MQRSLLITDVDNTLLDWQELWYQTFSAMIGRVIEISHVDESLLYEQCSVIHQKYGTSEYSQLLEELPCLRERYGDGIREAMEPAISAFCEARRTHLKLYPNVKETLARLRGLGVTIAAYTESKAFYTNYRFRKLGLDGLVDVLFSPADHALPVDDPQLLRRYSPETYELKHTRHHHTPEGELKPNPAILGNIISDLGFSREETVYVGDSKLKDIHMAQEAGVMDVYAEYGAAQHRPEYELLRKVTHWTPEMVAREKAILANGSVIPTYVLRESFEEILPFFEKGS
jgi:phosphoglycolate phosphatase